METVQHDRPSRVAEADVRRQVHVDAGRAVAAAAAATDGRRQVRVEAGRGAAANDGRRRSVRRTGDSCGCVKHGHSIVLRRTYRT